MLKREHPHYSTREVMRQVSEQWANMVKQERQVYATMASDDKRRFEAEMNKLRAGAGGSFPRNLSAWLENS